MKLKLNVLFAAIAALAAGAAHAQLALPGSGTSAAATANGSLAFVAMDVNGSPISFEANLDYKLLDFLPTSAVNTAPKTIAWNFANNTVTVDGATRAASSGSYAYSSAFTTFLGTAQAADVQWGVYAADNNGNATAGATNLARRNLAATGAPTVQNLNDLTNAGLSGATANVNGYFISLNAQAGQTIGSTAAGAATSTSGTTFLNDTQASQADFGGKITWSYLLGDKAVSPFTFLTGAGSGTPIASAVQYGSPNSASFTLAENPSTFTFDTAASTLTWTVSPVPEPGTYALFIAGLAAVGFLVRRRQGS